MFLLVCGFILFGAIWLVGLIKKLDHPKSDQAFLILYELSSEKAKDKEKRIVRILLCTIFLFI